MAQIVTGFRFDDYTPKIGVEVHCFKNKEALKNFVKLQGVQGALGFWQIEGRIIRDEGGVDGWILSVQSYKQIHLS